VKKTVALLTTALLVSSTAAAFASTPKPAHSGGMAGMNMSPATPPAISGTPAMMGGTILDKAIPSDIAKIPLVDSNGKTFSLASLKGKTIVLTDFFTSCDMICPMTSVNMRDIATAVAAAGKSSSVAVVELTIDPQRDTVSRINAYQKLFGTSNWTIATGTASDLKKLWAWFGVYAQQVPNTDGDAKDWQTGKKLTYDVIHEDIVTLIGPNSHYRWIDLGNPQVSNPTILPAKLKAFLSELGLSNLVKPQQPSWSTAVVYDAMQQIFGLPIGPKMKM